MLLIGETIYLIAPPINSNRPLFFLIRIISALKILIRPKKIVNVIRKIKNESTNS